jgi:2,3-dihydroxybiphenyl 1,2-dioxygenase
MTVSQLGYIGLEVSDMAAWECLARDVLAFDVSKPDKNGVVNLRMDEYSHRIALHPGKADDLIYAGWQVATKEDFESLKADLSARNIQIRNPDEDETKQRRVVDLFKFEHCGIPAEIFYGPTIEWDRPPQFERPIGGFKTQEGGLGHIVVHSPDVPAAVSLYRDCLGFRVSDYIWDITFMRCNPRHHSIAIEPQEGKGKRLAHAMIEYNTLRDVGAAWDRLRATKTPFTKTLGQHTNDHMVSFYLTTPSGFDIECGWGGRQVDDRTWEVQYHTLPSIWGHKRPKEA